MGNWTLDQWKAEVALLATQMTAKGLSCDSNSKEKILEEAASLGFLPFRMEGSSQSDSEKSELQALWVIIFIAWEAYQ